MRVAQEYKGLGLFWLPSDPESTVFGNLSISDGGKVQLELFGPFDPDPHKLNGFSRDRGKTDRINGCLEDGKCVTLERCLHTNQGLRTNNQGGTMVKSVIHVHQAFIGAPYEEEKITFNSLSFSIDGLHEWLGIKSIHRDHKDNLKSATITYERPKNLIYKLKNAFTLLIGFEVNLSDHGSPTTEAKISQKACFKLKTDTDQEFSKFTDIARKLTNLICFAVGETVSLSEVTATSQKDETNRIKLYYKSLPFIEEEPKVRLNRMIFRFSDVEEKFKEIIDRWLSAYEDISPTLNLYFSATTGGYRYLEGKFLALAQGLENLSRNKYPVKAKKPTLRQRIEQLVKPFEDYVGGPEEGKILVDKTVDTRNYYTHYDERLKDRAADGEELWKLCQKMEAIFELHFMDSIIFRDAEVTSVLNRPSKLKSKLELKLGATVEAKAPNSCEITGI